VVTPDQIRYSHSPPGGEYIPVISAPLGSEMQLLVAGPAIGVLTHYIDGRSWPCIGAAYACGWCNVQRPRWKGYMPVHRAIGKRAVLEVTTGMARAMPLLLAPEIAGRWIKVWRKGPKRNSPALCSLCEWKNVEGGVLAFDVRPVLWRMWDLQYESVDR
jgi:hypothetical protein